MSGQLVYSLLMKNGEDRSRVKHHWEKSRSPHMVRKKVEPDINASFRRTLRTERMSAWTVESDYV